MWVPRTRPTMVLFRSAFSRAIQKNAIKKMIWQKYCLWFQPNQESHTFYWKMSCFQWASGHNFRGWQNLCEILKFWYESKPSVIASRIRNKNWEQLLCWPTKLIFHVLLENCMEVCGYRCLTLSDTITFALCILHYWTRSLWESESEARQFKPIKTEV